MLLSPDAGRVLWQVDGEGNLTARANQRNAGPGMYLPDGLNRPTLVKYFKGSSTTFAGFAQLSYDALTPNTTPPNYGVGHLTSVIEYASGGVLVDSLSLSYDLYGRINGVCQFWNGVSTGSSTACSSADMLQINWGTPGSADTDGHLVSLNYPSGRLVSYQYDALGRVSGITTTDPGGSNAYAVISSVNYEPIEGVDPGSHVATSWTFCATGSSQTYAKGFGTSGWVSSFTLGTGAVGISGLQSLYRITPDAQGRILWITNYDANQDAVGYTYDNLGRLTQASCYVRHWLRTAGA